MRLPQTQNLTDGELFWIIENGVRFTGMPAWSAGTKLETLVLVKGVDGNWKIRHSHTSSRPARRPVGQQG